MREQTNGARLGHQPDTQVQSGDSRIVGRLTAIDRDVENPKMGPLQLPRLGIYRWAVRQLAPGSVWSEKEIVAKLLRYPLPTQGDTGASTSGSRRARSDSCSGMASASTKVVIDQLIEAGILVRQADGAIRRTTRKIALVVRATARQLREEVSPLLPDSDVREDAQCPLDTGLPCTVQNTPSARDESVTPLTKTLARRKKGSSADSFSNGRQSGQHPAQHALGAELARGSLPTSNKDPKVALAELLALRQQDRGQFFSSLHELVADRLFYAQIVDSLSESTPDFVHSLVDLLAAATKVDPQFGRILVDKHLPEHVVDQKGDSEKRLGWLFAQVGRYDDYARVVNNQIKLGISPENLGPVLSLLHDGAEALGCEAINVFWKACFDALQDTSSELQKLFHRAYRKWQRKHATVLVSADDGQSGRQRDDSPQDESACPISPVPYGDELVKRISMVQLLKRQGELAAACKLFREIIQLRPDLADAAIHFHEKLEHANEASIELLEAALLAKSITDNQAVDGFPSYLKACALSFGGEVRSAEKWIEHAAELIAQDRVGRAVDIWMGIYEYFPRSKQFFLNELLDLQSSMDSESFLSALGVLPRYAGNQKVLALLAHLARAVITTKTEVAHALYEQILVAESGADNRLNFSKYLLLQGEVNRAIALWTDAAGVHTFEKLLFLHFALRCGVTLTDLNDLVTKTVTEERLGCLAFAYQQLISTKKLLLATAIIEKLFECRQDPLSASDKAVLRLCLAHRGISEELKGALLEGLRERDLMCQGEIERLLAEVAQSGADITTLAKDKEMEDYLRRHMPTLKTGRFFSNLSERQPLFSPGKATSRMARSVIAKPYRMTDNNSRPGMKRRE